MLCQFNHGAKVREISDISQFQGIFFSTNYKQCAGKKSELSNSKYNLLKNTASNEYKKPTNSLEFSWLLLHNSKFLLILASYFHCIDRFFHLERILCHLPPNFQYLESGYSKALQGHYTHHIYNLYMEYN